MANRKHKLILLNLSKWLDIYEISDALSGTKIFRGQREASWGITASLERVLDNLDMLEFAEEKILAEFKHTAHLYLGGLPQEEDWFGWLSLIQHYGGLTRLVDFSKSLYVALFFALEKDASSNSAVWVVNWFQIIGKLKKYGYINDEKDFGYVSSGKFFNDNFRKSFDNYSVGFDRPLKSNERLLNQQGTFLFPLNLKYSFEENLFGMLDVDKEDSRNLFFDSHNGSLINELRSAPIIKIIIEKKFRSEGFDNLRKMNINHRIIYPDLEGYMKYINNSILKQIKP